MHINLFKFFFGPAFLHISSGQDGCGRGPAAARPPAWRLRVRSQRTAHRPARGLQGACAHQLRGLVLSCPAWLISQAYVGWSCPAWLISQAYGRAL